MIMTIALLFIRIFEFFAHLKRAIEIELEVRHAITELSEMSDHMLRDLGITRSEIERVVRRPNVPVGTDDSLSIPGDETGSIVPNIVGSPRRSDAPVRSLPPQAAT
jgi:uncharacterized protein YjiS (DUF1127 family)